MQSDKSHPGPDMAQLSNLRESLYSSEDIDDIEMVERELLKGDIASNFHQFGLIKL